MAAIGVHYLARIGPVVNAYLGVFSVDETDLDGAGFRDGKGGGVAGVMGSFNASVV